jgi:hypothetical protein
MSTDPLGEALGGGHAAAAQPGQPAAQPGGAQPAGGPQAAPAYQAPSAYEPQPSAPAWDEPVPERSLVERRPEILVGAALAGGFVAAQLLGRIRGR